MPPVQSPIGCSWRIARTEASAKTTANLRLHSRSPGVLRSWQEMMTSAVPTPPDDASFADRRVYPRVEVALPAFLQANGERHSVQIVDLSAGGAKLDCAISLPTGTAVVLDCGTLGRTAVVRWKSAGVL